MIYEVHFSKWILYHHDMAYPQVADGEDGLQIWRITANIFNKQLQRADKGGHPAGGLVWK
jgi:hypothetical protein